MADEAPTLGLNRTPWRRVLHVPHARVERLYVQPVPAPRVTQPTSALLPHHSNSLATYASTKTSAQNSTNGNHQGRNKNPNCRGIGGVGRCLGGTVPAYLSPVIAAPAA